MWQIISIIFGVLTENFYVAPFPCKFRFSFGGKFKFTKETLNYKKTLPLSQKSAKSKHTFLSFSFLNFTERQFEDKKVLSKKCSESPNLSIQNISPRTLTMPHKRIRVCIQLLIKGQLLKQTVGGARNALSFDLWTIIITLMGSLCLCEAFFCHVSIKSSLT